MKLLKLSNISRKVIAQDICVPVVQTEFQSIKIASNP